MAPQECGGNVNRETRELQAHGTIEFPCAGYVALYSAGETAAVPRHWHE